MAQHQTSSSGYVSKQLEAISLAKPLSISFPRYLLLSFSVRTTHVQAIRYDWLDPRFRTNHFIKAPVLNKPAFDYSPRATLSLSSLIPSPSFAPTDRIVSLHRRTNYLVVYPAATDHRPIASRGETKPVNSRFGNPSRSSPIYRSHNLHRETFPHHYCIPHQIIQNKICTNEIIIEIRVRARFRGGPRTRTTLIPRAVTGY